MRFDRRAITVAFFILSLLTYALPTSAFSGEPASMNQKCVDLAKLPFPHSRVLEAQWTPAGAGASANLPGGPLPRSRFLSASYAKLPAFCRLFLDDRPTAESHIRIEIWLPGSGWNGKYRGQGNGGFAGSIDYGGLAAAVRQGYASAATDTGHVDTGRRGLEAEFAIGHPEQVKDFGWRAIHEMTLLAKAAIQAFYGEQPRYSYFASCSDGGREALMEAQRFPTDYNGIIAGDPANNWTALQVAAMWDVHQMELTPASYIPPQKVAAIAAAVLAACDAADGVRDGILDDPRQCHFNPATMLCKNGDSDICLLPGQVETLLKIYAGPHDSAGKQVFPGFLPGGENGRGGWVPWITGTAPRRSIGYLIGAGFVGDFVYQDEHWNPSTFDFQEALKLADEKFASALNATDPNLKAFAAAGGKLILYQGWNDPAVPALSTLDYYNSVVSRLGRVQTGSFVRLYMAPGMQHCSGGPGPSHFGQDPMDRRGDASHDIFTALEQWVERDRAPGRLVAARLLPGMKAPAMTRPLCPYPETIRYSGAGSTSDAANFSCVNSPE